MDAMHPARRQKIEKRVEESLAATPFEELRKARDLTQIQLAELMGVQQREVSNMEYRSDVSVGALAEYIEALGGRLEIRAVFPDRQVLINHSDEMLR